MYAYVCINVYVPRNAHVAAKIKNQKNQKIPPKGPSKETQINIEKKSTTRLARLIWSLVVQDIYTPVLWYKTHILIYETHMETLDL